MKTFIMIFALFLSSLLAEEKPIIADVSAYVTSDKTLNATTIKNYTEHFKKLNENSSFEKEQWIKIRLKDDLQSGRYYLIYNYADFTLSSFTTAQEMRKFTLFGNKHLSFFYDSVRDSKTYYFHLLPTDITYPGYLYAVDEKIFYESLGAMRLYILLSGIVLGLIMMTAIYNGALYYFNGEKSFLYYALMQLFMVTVLSFHTGVPHTLSPYLLHHPDIYEYLSLFTAFFATLFARSFLDTKEHLPKHDKVLLLFLAIIMIDMLYYPKPLLAKYGLYSLTTLYFIIIGYLRMRQGYKPARFYFLAWVALTIGILVIEHFEEYAYFDTMLLGSTIEAIMLALALAYKIRQIQSEKEQQKELLIHQSKLASMGEMLGNIAHQWRQPLTNLSYIFMNIEELDDKKQRSKKVEEGTRQLEFMSQTIDDFKDFYTPTKEKEQFDIAKQVEEVLTLMHFGDIKIDFDKKKDFHVLNYKNEFKQVLLNLLSNAKEALLEKQIKAPRITIMIDAPTIMIKDNAGGIKERDIQKIFAPYFSTKQNSSGIGLYMSKMIVEKNMKGNLTVKNNTHGAEFTIRLA